MKRKILLVTALVAVAAVFCAPVSALSARSACVMDAQTGQMLYAQNAEQQSLIASTTKIMTGLLVCKDCCLDRSFTVPPEAVGIEGSSLYLQAGETLRLEELLYGMMLQSGNDAAVALAIAHSGSVEAFVARMNERAQALGLHSTHFANPHGLDDDGNYSTAADLARLACAAMDNTAFARVVSTKSCRFGARSFTNHNKLLWRLDGAEGVKTGYTKAAGRILVSSACRRGRRLVCVTIHAPDDWNDHCALLEAGFSRFQSTALCEKGQVLGARTGADGSVYALLAADRSITAYLLPGERVSRISVFCGAAGEHYAAFYSGEQQLACCPLAEIGVTNGRTYPEDHCVPGHQLPPGGGGADLRRACARERQHRLPG